MNGVVDTIILYNFHWCYSNYYEINSYSLGNQVDIIVLRNSEVFNTMTSCFYIKDFSYFADLYSLNNGALNFPKKAINKEVVFEIVPRTRKEKKNGIHNTAD